VIPMPKWKCDQRCFNGKSCQVETPEGVQEMPDNQCVLPNQDLYVDWEKVIE